MAMLCANTFNIQTINLSILHNYFDDPNKIIFCTPQQNRSSRLSLC